MVFYTDSLKTGQGIKFRTGFKTENPRNLISDDEFTKIVGRCFKIYVNYEKENR